MKWHFEERKTRSFVGPEPALRKRPPIKDKKDTQKNIINIKPKEPPKLKKTEQEEEKGW